MKYELSHDVLALKAYERASADDKALRKVERLIKERHAFFKQRRTLLSQDDLDYIKPYLDQVTISEDENEFIERSARALKRRRRLLILLIVAIFLALSGLTAFALVQNQNAQQEKENAIAASELAVENERKAQQEKENALVASKRAAENAQKALENEKAAQLQRDIALQARIEADENAAIARERQREAAIQRDSAFQARNKANANARLALDNEERAKKNEARADSLRILSLAQSLMAIAAQVEDSSLRVKLANQAYDFHIQQNGDPFDPVIHDGLREALLAANWKNSIQKHQSAITGMAFSPDGKSFYSTARDGKLIQWNWNDRLDEANSVILENPFITQGGLSINDEWLVVSGDQASTLQVFKLKDFPKPWSERIPIEQAVNDLVFHPSDKHQLLLATSQGVAYANIQASRANEAVFSFSDTMTNTIAVHPSGKYIAGIREGGMLEIGVAPKQNVLPPFHSTSDISAIAFSDKGDLFAVGDRSGKVWLYDFPSGDLVVSLGGHSARISQAVFYQQSGITFLVSAGYDGKAQLWYWQSTEKAQMGRELAARLPIVLKADEKWEFSLTFSPDGKQILMGNRNGMIQQWLINIDDMAQFLKDKVSNLKLTEEEWRQYLKDEPYRQ